MRFLTLIVLLVLLVGAGLGSLINVDPGYVLLAWGDTSIEMSIWVLLIGIVLVFVTMSLSLRFIIALNLPFRVLGSWQQTSRIKRMQLQTRQGLLALADGKTCVQKKFWNLRPLPVSLLLCCLHWQLRWVGRARLLKRDRYSRNW